MHPRSYEQVICRPPPPAATAPITRHTRNTRRNQSYLSEDSNAVKVSSIHDQSLDDNSSTRNEACLADDNSTCSRAQAYERTTCIGAFKMESMKNGSSLDSSTCNVIDDRSESLLCSFPLESMETNLITNLTLQTPEESMKSSHEISHSPIPQQQATLDKMLAASISSADSPSPISTASPIRTDTSPQSNVCAVKTPVQQHCCVSSDVCVDNSSTVSVASKTQHNLMISAKNTFCEDCPSDFKCQKGISENTNRHEHQSPKCLIDEETHLLRAVVLKHSTNKDNVD